MLPIFKVLMLLLGAVGSMTFAGAMVLAAMFGVIHALLALPLAVAAIAFAAALVTRASNGEL